MRPKFPLIITFILAIITGVSTVYAEVINVPDDFETIQEAIIEAEDGDVVLIQPGRYVENINFLDKEITVASLYLNENDPEHIENTIIDGGGGGTIVSIRGGVGAEARLIGLTITNGSANYGGGLYINNARPTLDHLLITGNHAARWGGGIYCTSDALPSLTNITIANNTAEGGNGGIHVYGGASANMVNCISYGNQPAGRPNGMTVTYSDIQGGYAGNGNINQDPLFVDPGEGDFYITENSPCIDTGDPNSDDDPDETRADMGAFYFDQPEEPNIAVSPAELNFGDVELEQNAELTLTISNIGRTDLTVMDITIHEDGFTHDFEEDEVVIDPDNSYDVIVTFAPEETQDYQGTLIITSDDPDQEELDVALTGTGVEPRDHRIDVPDDYDTIQEAIDNALDTDTVLVAPGTYTENINFSGKEILVGSLFITTGDADYVESTIIDGDANNTSVVTFANGETVNSILSGFTIFNGRANFGAGILCNGSAPTLDHLLITGNNAVNRGGGIIAYANARPTIRNITLTGNSADQGNGALSIFSGAVVNMVNSIFWDNDPPDIPANQTITYSDVQGGYAGAGNIDTDPLFADPDNNDYHLTDDSPCIDTGDPDSPEDPDGTRADMGTFPLFQAEGPSIVVSPEALDFAEVVVDQSADLTLTIRNRGREDLNVSDITIEGNIFRSDFDNEVDIEPGNTYEVTVTFQPDDTGDFNGTLVITSNDPDNEELEVNLTGIGVEAIPSIDPFPDALDFGAVVVNGDADLILTIANVGFGDLTVSDVTFEGDNFSSDFENEVVIEPDDSYELTVTFSPDDVGDFNGTLTIASDDPENEELAVALSGIGRSFRINVPDDYDTIQEAIDNAIDTDTVLVAPGTYTENINFGGKEIVVGSQFITTGNADFVESTIIDGDGNITSVVTFANGETVNSVLSGFTIRNGGANFGAGILCNGGSPMLDHLLITDNHSVRWGGAIIAYGGGSPTMRNVTLTGNDSEQNSGTLDVFGGSVVTIVNSIFWDNDPPDIPANQTITFSDIQGGYNGRGNIDTDPLFVDPDNDDFHLTDDSPCKDTGNPDAPEDPDGTRADMGTFPLFQVEGPSIVVSPEALDFAEVVVDQGADLTLTIRNRGREDLRVSDITIEGDNFRSNFENAVVIEPGNTSEVIVTFQPNATGDFAGTLVITSNDPDNEDLEVNLTGIGVEAIPAIVVLPDALDFGAIPVDDEAGLILTISNTGFGDLTISDVTIEGDNFISDFENEVVIEPDDSYELNVTFSPDDVGDFNGTLTIASNDPENEDLAVALSGSGRDYIINVPDDYDTIQEAIDNAVDGDTVLVQPETYTEIIDFIGKNIVVGSLYITTGDPDYIASTIIDGDANGRSVTVFRNGETNEAVLAGFTIRNADTDFGGGSYIRDASPTLHHLLITANHVSGRGAGIYATTGAQPLLNNITFTNNDADGANGGIGVGGGGAQTQVINSIFWGNTPAALPGGQTITYSDVQGGYAGAGNLDSDPLFADFDNDDFQLTEDSPCINAGDPNSPQDPDETRNDMGAFYFELPEEPNISVIPAQLIFGEVELELSAELSLTIRNNGRTDLTVTDITIEGDVFTHDFEEDEIVIEPDNSYDVTVTFAPDDIEDYQGTLTITSDDPNEEEVDVALTGTGIEPLDHVHDVPDDFDTIQEAIDNAIDTDTVLVAPGTYTENINFNGKEIIVGSLFITTGDADYVESTIIDGDANNTSVVTFANGETVNSILSGFTIRNGAADFGGGILCNGGSPILDHLLITDNHTVRWGGAIIAYGGGSPTMTNVTLTRNDSEQNNGVLDVFGGSVVTIVNSIFWDNAPPDIPANQTITFSDIQGGYNGRGNIDTDPLFVDPDNDDFHLTDDSPCKDTGNPDAPEDPDGTRADMGTFPLFQAEGPSIVVSPEALDFAEVVVDQSADLILTIRNRGRENLNVSDITIEGDIFSSDFENEVVIEPGNTSDVTVTFQPDDTGDLAGTLVITSNDPDNENLDVNLTGIGVEAIPAIDVSPDALDFGAVPIDDEADLILTISNTGFGDLTISDITIEGDNFISDFENEIVIQPNESRELTVTFSPDDIDDFVGTLTIASDDPENEDLAVALSGSGRDFIINVPDDYDTIQEAIDNAADGDTVLVQPETYTEIIDFIGKNIVVGSLYITTGDPDYIASTIIDGDANGRSVTVFRNGETNEAVLAGFTIRNADTDFGGGSYIRGANPTLHHLLITGNHVSGRGAGIYVTTGAQPLLNNITFTNNDADGGNGGIGVGGGGAQTQAVNSIFWGNTPAALPGGQTITYSDVQGGYNGAGNIDQDPLFADFDNDDFQLTEDSPCIDVGDPNSPQDSDETRADMGAFYYQQQPQPPTIRISPGALDFGESAIDIDRDLILTITNVGNEDLIITDITIQGDEVFQTVFEDEITIEPDNSIEQTVTFTPVETIDYAGTLTITSNDPQNEEIEVDLTGIGTGPQIRQVGHYETPGMSEGVYVSRGLAYIADYWEGMQIVDVSDPGQPQAVGSYDTPGEATGIDVAGSYAYVADAASGLRIIDISDPENPNEVGTFDTPGAAYAVYYKDNLAYVADGASGLRIIDVSNPDDPDEIGAFDTPGQAFSVYVSGDYAYLADQAGGLRIIDVSDPENPDEVSNLEMPSRAYGVFAAGDYAYVAASGSGLRIINVSNPAEPEEVGFVNTPGSSESVFVAHDFAYVADGDEGLRLIDVSNPAEPEEIGFHDTPGYAIGLYVSGNYAYITDEDEGLYIFNCSEVTGGIVEYPEITIDPEAIGFPDTEVGRTSLSVITISNTGDTDLYITDVTFEGDYFSSDFTDEIIIEPVGQTFLSVVFSPTETGDHEATMTITSDDPDNGELAVALSGTGIEAQPREYNVPDDFETIQAAIDEAIDIDRVLVDPGVYNENINFRGKNITVASQYIESDDPDDIASTIIDGGDNGRSVVAFRNGETDEAELIGFTIRNGSTDFGGGLYINDASPTLDHLVIYGNSSTSRGGGIYATNNANPDLNFITLYGNTANEEVGAINIFAGASATIGNSIVWGNQPAGMPNGLTVAYCDIEGGYAGVDNLDSDPIFADTDNNDFYITEDSPCVDAADPDAPEDPDTTRADMGALYFFQEAAPVIAVTPAELVFPNTVVGHETDMILTIDNNEGRAPLTVSDISIAGDYFTSDFDGEVVIEPDEPYELTVTFAPDATGDLQATLTITSDDPDNGELDVNLSGLGVAPILTHDPESLNFGEVVIDQTVELILTIGNDGDGDLTISDISIGHDNFSSIFEDIDEEMIVEPDATFELPVRFTPDSENNFEGTLTITSDDPDNGEVDVALVGVGREPAIPEVGHYNTNGVTFGIDIVGDIAYLADNAGGLRIIDISDPENPDEIGFCETPGNAYDVVVSDNLAFVADYESGLRIIDVSNPEEPDEIGSCDTPDWAEGIAVSGDYVYIADGRSGLQAINISDPEDPRLTGSFNTPQIARDVVIVDEIAYVADNQTGLILINARNLGGLGIYDTPGAALGVSVIENYAYVADYTEGLRIIDISNPDELVEVGSQDTRDYARDLTVVGNIAYVACFTPAGQSSLRLIDVSDPENPDEVGNHRTQHSWDVSVVGNYAYVADGNNGLLILDVSDFVQYPEITLSDEAFDFGEVVTGETEDLTLTISNDGNWELTISDISIRGAQTFLTDFDEEIVIQPFEDFELTVTFAPEEVNDFDATLTILSDDPDDPEVEVALSGSGVAPDITVNRNSFPFGDCLVGQISTLPLIITNDGNSDLTVSDISIEGQYFSSDFEEEFVIAPDGNRQFNVNFQPNETGDFEGTLTITSNDPDEGEINIPLTGSGLTPDIAVDPEALAFPETEMGRSSQLAITISNEGNIELTVSDITIAGAYYSSDFLNPIVIQPDESSEVNVTFLPGETGDLQAVLTITSDDPDEGEVTVDLSGTGIETEARTVNVPDDYETIQEAIDVSIAGDIVLVQPGTYEENVNFNGIDVTVGSLYLTTGEAEYIESTIIDGGANGRSTVVFRNGETEAAILTGFTVRNADTDWGGGIYCNGDQTTPTLDHLAIVDNVASGRGGGLYATSGSIPILVNVTISGNTANSDNAAIGIGGGGASAQVINSIIWGNEPPDLQNGMTITFSDIEGSYAGAGNIEEDPLFADADNSDYQILRNSPCVDTGDPNADQDPDETRADMGALYYHQAQEPNLMVNPNELNFGQVSGGESADLTLTLSNDGLVELNVSDIAIEGNYFSSDFDEAFVIQPDEEFDLTVTFAPQESGDFEATLTISSDDPDEEVIAIALTGTGVVPIIVVEPEQLDFGAIQIERSIDQRLTISNEGDGPLTVSDVTVEGVWFSSSFEDPIVIDPVGQTFLSVTFAPQEAGDFEGTLTITSNDPENGEIIVQLSGAGREPDIDEVGNYDTDGTAYGVTVIEDFAFVADGDGGLRVIDITDPENPDEVASAGDIGTAMSVVVSEDYAFVAADENGLQVIDVFDPGDPNPTGEFDTPGNAVDVAVVGTIAYIADMESGLRVVNISNRAHPSEVGSFNTEGLAHAVTVIGEYAYVADGANGLLVLNISDPENIEETGRYDTPDIATEIFIIESIAYVTDNESGLHILDISDPENIEELGELDTPDRAVAVTVLGRFAYVADMESGLQVIDISDLGNIGETASYNTPDEAYDVSVIGTHAYVADGASGLRILNVTDFMPHPAITVSTYNLDFGEVVIDDNARMNLTIGNEGEGPLTVSEVTIEGDNFNSDFEDAINIEPDDNTDLIVTFSPDAVADFEGIITIASNDPEEDEITITLTGSGVAPDIAVEPEILEFGEVSIDDSEELILTIRNEGAADLTVSEVTIRGSETFVPTFENAIVIQPEGQASLPVTFTPDDIGDFEAFMTLISDDPDERVTTIELTGIGIPGRHLFNVPDDYGTIQAAINAVENGDTVLVHSGTYSERINFIGKEIVVASLLLTTGDQAYIESTIIDGNAGGSVVTLRDGIGVDAVLMGFTIRNGNSNYGGGIYINDAAPTLDHLLIQGNNARRWGGAIYSTHDSDPTLINVTITGNIGETGNGGIHTYDNSSAQIVNSIFWGNQPGATPAGLTIAYSDIQGGYAGAGNIDSDPLFADIDNDDYSLTRNSPCIDSGDPDAPDDPDETQADMGAFYFHQEPEAGITVTPASLDFGGVAVHQRSDLILTIGNEGNADLTVSDISIDENYFSSNFEDELVIEPEGSFELIVSFIPEETGDFTATMTISSDDPNNDELTVDLTGTGREPQIDEVGSYDTPGDAQGIFVVNDFAYVADGNSGLRMIDVTDPENPDEIGFYNTPGTSRAVFVIGNYAYVADFGSGLRIIDISDPENPEEVGALERWQMYAWDVCVEGDYAYVADESQGSSALSIIDISDPENPDEISTVETPGNSRGVDVNGNYAYLAAAGGGLRIIDVSNPEDPDEIGSFDTPGQAWDVVIVGDYAYVAQWNDGLIVVDVSDPENPAEVGSFDTEGEATGIDVRGNSAFVCDGEEGLGIIDVSDPEDMSEIAAHNTDGLSKRVQIVGDMAYVADGENGLVIIDVTDFVPHPAIVISPNVLDFGNVSIHESEELILTISNEGNGDLTIFEITSDGEDFSFDFAEELTIESEDNYELTVTFAPEDAGVFRDVITISSNDPDNAELTVDIAGIAINDPPEVVNPIDDVEIDEDSGLLEVADLDEIFVDPNGVDLTFSVEGTEELNLEISDENILTLRPEDDFYGENLIVTVTADDEENGGRLMVNVQPSRSLAEIGGQYTYFMSALEKNDGPLTEIGILSPYFNPPPRRDETVSDEFTVTVNPLNDPPVWESYPEDNRYEVNEGNVARFELIAQDDVDNNNDLTIEFSDRGGLPDEAELNDNEHGTASFTWQTTFEDEGEYTPIFTVSDGEEDVDLEITIAVGNFNRPPEVVNPIDDIDIDEDAGVIEIADLDDVFDDPDGDDLEFDIIEANEIQELNANIDIETHILSVEPDPNYFGESEVIIEAEDSWGQRIMIAARINNQHSTFNIQHSKFILHSSPPRRDESITDEFTINVLSINDDPVIEDDQGEALGDEIDVDVTEEEELHIVFQASDVEDDVNDLVWSVFDEGELPDGWEFADNDDGTAEFTWTPGADDSRDDPYTPVFRVTDTDDGTDDLTVNITVNNINQPPRVVSPIADMRVPEDFGQFEVAVLDEVFEDPDDDDLSFSVEADEPLTAEIDDDNMLLLEAPENFNGDDLEVTVTADDDQGGRALMVFRPSYNSGNAVKTSALRTACMVSASGNAYATDIQHSKSKIQNSSSPRRDDSIDDVFLVTITPVNDPPFWVDPLDEVNVDEGDEIEFTLTADDFDIEFEGDELELLMLVDDGTEDRGAEFTDNGDNTGTFNWQTDLDDEGEYSPIFEVSDQGGRRTRATVDITVGHVNQPPILVEEIPDQEFDEDDGERLIADLNDHFVDPDDDDDLEFQESDAEGLSIRIVQGRLYVQPEADWNGNVDVTITASDGEETAEDVFEVVVNAINDAPRIVEQIENIRIDEDPDRVDVADLDEVFYDIEEDEMNFSVIDAPEELNMEVDQFNVLHFEPEPNYNIPDGVEITIRATDEPGASTDLDFRLVINPVNDPPEIIEDIGDIILDEDPDPRRMDICDMDDIFSDPDGDQLNYEVTQAPEGLNMQINQWRILFFEPDDNYNVPGAEIIITAADNQDASTDIQFSVTINSVNDLPTPFDLLTPEDNGYWADTSAVVFSWQESVDEVEDSTITYAFVANFNGEDHWYRDLEVTGFTVTRADLVVNPEDTTDVEWWVWAYDGIDSLRSESTYQLRVAPLSVDDNPEALLPTDLTLGPIYPNPFNARATISYSIPSASRVSLAVYNLSGRKVATLVDSYRQAGKYSAVLSSDNITSGVYIVRIAAAGIVEVQKVMLIR
ncbi:MAG: choice-of-anchor D domain-containing protein [Candidatus Hatepunaea meridiana]|nr:choice-of-anchor D domain-containing protein [Candidatus Hatepunaea meridiana]